ncbi:hypothetical protein GVX81_03070 [[Haemophilus] felis]|uniref:Uncharacterized protein n=1 Tax=[Haemophilus] felis TaxID=123822 RepID=A0A1T0BBB9_9PAST|nr:hypothetical protein [[Haemophilus] felis]NBI40348.1 hypothetical protein [[Haemophilus] felis]OOS07081.1 hypothetical protein B0188_01465 [[Haemophilus] felis]
MLAKIGFNATAVWQMSHIELNAWIDTYLAQQGIKSHSTAHNTAKEQVKSYVFRRRKSQQQTQENKG